MTAALERKPRVIVIGLDGATLDLAEPWLASGQLPHLALLSQRGGYGRLQSVWPVLSPAAWTSFATGLNPGRHGIFDFVQRAPDSYNLKLVTARDIRAPTLWRLLSEAGKRVAVINVPMSYPAEPVNGIMITGLGTPDGQVFTHPPELSGILQAQGYRVNKSVFYRPGNEAAFLKDVYDLTRRVGETALNILCQEPWDFFMVVFRDTDEMAHYFWKHMDSSHPAHSPRQHAPWATALRDYYQYLDTWVGRLVESAGSEVDVIVMSDHGMGPLYKDVYLNEWLRQQGWLKAITQQLPPGGWLGRIGITRSKISNTLQRLGLAHFERWLRTRLRNKISILPANNRVTFPDTIDWSQTQAYSYGYHGQIFLNVIGREPSGIVDSDTDYRKLISDIESSLRAMTDSADGRAIVTDIIRQRNAFHGPYTYLGADLVIVMRDMSYITRQGYEFSSTRGEFLSYPTTYESGSHRIDGLLFVSGPSFNSSGNSTLCSIMDISPTIMNIFGLSVAENMDGKILSDKLRSVRMDVVDLSYVYSRYDTSIWYKPLTRDEENELTERLRNLGYLG